MGVLKATNSANSYNGMQSMSNLNNNNNNGYNHNQHNGHNGHNGNNGQIVNSYTSMNNPAAVFQRQQQQGSQYGSFIGMQPQMGSNRNLNQYQNNPNGTAYGINAPSSDFINQYGPSSVYAQQQGNQYGAYYNAPYNTYYTTQPQGGQDSIVPPPPMITAANGELIPTSKRKKKDKKDRKHRSKKDKHKKHRKDKKHRKHRSKHRDHDGKKKKRSS